MATVPWIKSMLESGHVAYQESRHATAITAQEVAEKEHISGRRTAKVVVLIADGRPAQLVLPASLDVDLAAARRALGAREARLATEAEMEDLFRDCELGAEPPLPHWPGVELWADEALLAEPEILFQAGTHQDAVRMATRDWAALTNPKAASFAVEKQMSWGW